MPVTAEPSTPPSLLERLRHPDDRGGWAKFVDLYTPLLLAWVKRLGTPDADRADVVQEVFRVLVRELPTFRYDPARKFRGYLFDITRQRAVDHFRRRGTALPADMDATVSPDTVSAWVDADYDSHLIRRALALVATDFDPPTAEAFRRYAVGGESPAAVAAALGLSPAAVYQAVYRVRQRLRQEFAGLLD